MQLSAIADLETGAWHLAADGRWLTSEPGDASTAVELGTLPDTGIDSARVVAVWSANGDFHALRAIRPSGAKGQDKDEVSVTLPEPRAEEVPETPEEASEEQTPERVFDPRLSTEYGPENTPRRFGIELWMGTEPDGPHRPVRLSGELRNDAAPQQHGPLSVYPMHARANGVPGMALYLLLKP
ncbi:MAG: hypothetical protein J2O48_05900 [Solirubrobacterales bacterium]|nr:hypothetical protein [Solirubrobacterales bacterium]